MSTIMAIACSSVLVSAAGGDAAHRLPEIRFEKYTLPNGLQVILHEDHATPIVGVNVWYHVGSKNERPGRTGFAHLFEHMMFQGSKHFDSDYFGPLQKAGGRLNGSTSQDRTNYWETVPANYLELALWMESDRMGFLLPAMTQTGSTTSASVVKNERRQSYENRPYGLVLRDDPRRRLSAGLSLQLADDRLDGRHHAASLEDVPTSSAATTTRATPACASPATFNPAEAKRLVDKYFGPLPAGPKVEKLDLPAPPPGRRSGSDDRPRRPGAASTSLGTACRNSRRTTPSWRSWPTCSATARPRGSTEPWSATSKSPRTFTPRRTRRSSPADSRSAPTARSGHTLAELEAAILAEVARIQAEPPTADEIARAVNRTEADLVLPWSRSVSLAGGPTGLTCTTSIPATPAT